MKIDMEIVEERHKVSLFSSVPVFRVNVTAEFTEEEKLALKRSGAMPQIFLSYDLHPKDELNRRVYEGDKGHVFVEGLVKNSGCRPYYLTSLAAQNALSEIEDQFRALKQNILAIDAPKSKSLEL